MEPRSRRIQGRAFRVASAGVLALAMTAMVPTPGTASAEDCPGGQSPSSEGQCVSDDVVATSPDGTGQPDCNSNAGAPDGASLNTLSDGQPYAVPSQESMCTTPGDASIEVTQPVEMGAGFGESACPGGCEG